MDNPQDYLGRLKPIHFFKGLPDDSILDFIGQMEPVRIAADTVIFEEGEEGQYFFIIHTGQVDVSRQVRGEPKHLATLEPGDYFGEAALLYGHRRSATIVTKTDVELLRLSKETFDELLLRYPQIKPNLLVEAESRELYRRMNLDWLEPAEVVYLVARRHPLLLWQSLAPPIGAALLVLAITIAAALTFDLRLALFALALGGLPALGWGVWNYVDWGNDYYIVTNQRVVYLEKVVGIYDSRQEAPLRAIQSVSVQTAGTLERALGIGDVIVRTFFGPITMKSVANPASLSALVEEHWNRTKTRIRQADQEALREAVRRRISPALPEPRKPPARPPARPRPAARPLADALSFRVRYERGDSIIYRKHWFVLLQEIWQPSLFLLADLGLIGLKLGGILPPAIPWAVVLLVSLVGLIPFGFWWWYVYEDWKNDIYQVTNDQILDIAKKPLGQESRKAAPLGNVLSLQYERPGLLGLLLNYGSVKANIAGQQFDFDDVFDPMGVQNDIYRRMEALSARKAEAEAAKKREEMADWVGVYHRVMNDAGDERPRPGSKNIP